LIGILIADVGALAVLTSERVPQSAEGRAKIIPDAGATGADSLAAISGRQVRCCPGHGRVSAGGAGVARGWPVA
jgi:hypothetical protein